MFFFTNRCIILDYTKLGLTFPRINIVEISHNNGISQLRI